MGRSRLVPLSVCFLGCEDNILTRRERLKSALYLRLKKRKTFFWKKNLKFLKIFFFRKMSHSAEKNQKGGPFSLGRFCRLRLKSKKTKGGTLWRQKKFRKKSRTVPEKKIERGDPLVCPNL